MSDEIEPMASWTPERIRTLFFLFSREDRWLNRCPGCDNPVDCPDPFKEEDPTPEMVRKLLRQDSWLWRYRGFGTARIAIIRHIFGT